MRKALIAFLLIFSVVAKAQLNNSWIDYNKTYYKFKLGKTGLYRISQPVLASMGLGNTPVEYFQLWRNGQQVRLYTSSSSGSLDPSGYIEFLGKMNDGVPDKELYLKPGYQLCDSFSLHTDTASYFLTVDQFSANLRFTDAINDVASNTLPVEPYFLRTVAQPYKQQYNRGYAVYVGELVYSSSYDIGEGWTSGDVAPCCDLFKTFDNLNIYTAGPANSVSLDIAAFGNALNVRNLRVKFFNNIVLNTPMNFYDTIKKHIDSLPLSYLANPSTLQVAVNGTSAVSNDRIVVANVAVTFPSKFIFNNQQYFSFKLQPSATGNFLEITSFNNGSVAPVLYSLNDGRRYTGDISVAGKIRFALPPSTSPDRNFILVSEDASNVTAISDIIERKFTNFVSAANQGNYIIISNPLLYDDGNGNNYVEEYRKYRASAAGGSFRAVTVSIDELTDQFAFGIRQHPASIRSFVRYAYQQFNPKPEFIYLIGKGITSLDFKQHESDPITNKLDLVPTFGWPASDVLLACEPAKNVPLIPISRLSAVNGTEIKNYLDKVKEYEQVQATNSPSISDKAWMKNIIHVIGGADSSENATFRGYMNNYKTMLEDSLMGAHVESFEKTSTSYIEQASGERIEQMINEGVTEIGYFGHSSANTLAFNLSSPDLYHNNGRYPFFNVSGCSAGNFFNFDAQRLTGTMSISEKYVLAPQKGSIGFLASTYLGIPPFLNFYNNRLHRTMAYDLYGNAIGKQIQKVLEDLGSNPGSLDFYTRIHLEELNLHGDPAIKVNPFTLPDYAIEDPLVKISPNVVTVADDKFSLKVKWVNIGRAINDSIRILIKRKLPNDTVQVVYNKLVLAPANSDSITLDVAINPVTDRGLNKIFVSIDADSKVNELYESNNDITKDFYILEDELRPVIPYNFSIVNQQGITFTGSTANPLSEQRQYLMEIDTTELFNSSIKKQYSATGTGGIVQFTPTDFTFSDSTVYYWRTSMVPVDATAPVWNSFSFIYMSGSSTGFNQSHYYQHKKSTYSNTIALNNDGVFRYTTANRNLQIKTGLYPYTPYDRITVTLDFEQLEIYGCKIGSLQFFVYDSLTMEPWTNYNVTPTEGRFGSWKVCGYPTRKFFEFPYSDPAYRKKAMDFLDSIPSGMYVSISNYGWMTNTSFINDWKNDTTTLGSGKSLYHKLKDIGFTKIDSFTRNLPFVFFFRKNTPSYAPAQVIAKTSSEELEGNFSVPLKYKTGTIESPAFGPAKNWTALHWRGKSVETQPGDTVSVEVYGIKKDGVTKTLLATVRPATDTSLAFVNATTYPYIKLAMQNSDVKFATPNQLQYWRINADYIPEGAVAPNLLFAMRDSVEQGEKIDFSLAFKNISTVAFDSLKTKFVITDRNNIAHTIVLPKAKPLISGDTIVVKYSIDTKDYPGLNTLNVIVNPDNDQPEQYAYNNFIFKDFYVNPDITNPLLDVTFDGVHILNRDIVSSRPHIVVKLKDESKYLALADTSKFTDVSVRFPDGSVRKYDFANQDTLKFIPANLNGGDNTASLEFAPYFPEDGEYEFMVHGKDYAGNKAGKVEYKVAFSVINKAMISNLLNYPNPFTTSTAFVFTLTGSEVPQNMRIQILTITGKVVREITKAELGEIHIGRNITEFKWDGTDMYGSKLANGVYLYRVLTNLNGKSLDKYKTEADNTDKFFKAGYGKMYLMR